MKIKYQRKYCDVVTLLNVTNENVNANKQSSSLSYKR